MRGLTDSQVQELTRKQITAFRHPPIQADVFGWWEASCSICGLCWRNFLPHHDFHGTKDIRETWQEETLVIARALQHCVEKLGVPSRVLFDAAWNLQRSMAPLMHLKGDDILEAWLLGATDNEPGASLTPAEESTLLGAIILHPRKLRKLPHPSDHLEETPKPKGAARLEWTAADSQDAQKQLLPLPPGFVPPTSGVWDASPQ